MTDYDIIGVEQKTFNFGQIACGLSIACNPQPVTQSLPSGDDLHAIWSPIGLLTPYWTQLVYLYFMK